MYPLFVSVWIGLFLHLRFAFSVFFFFFFFFFFFTRFALGDNYHCSRIIATLFMGPTTTLFRKKILKMGPTALFTHLKIILLQCFQFSVSTKISCIQMDPQYLFGLCVHINASDVFWLFFFFLLALNALFTGHEQCIQANEQY